MYSKVDSLYSNLMHIIFHSDNQYFCSNLYLYIKYLNTLTHMYPVEVSVIVEEDTFNML